MTTQIRHQTRAEREVDLMGGERRLAERRAERVVPISYLAERRKQQRRRAIKLMVLAFDIDKWRAAYIESGGTLHV